MLLVKRNNEESICYLVMSYSQCCIIKACYMCQNFKYITWYNGTSNMDAVYDQIMVQNMSN